MKKSEIRELIEQGEGYFVEFKKDIGQGLDREMVAFANSSGGKIVIGVADNGKVIGCTLDNSVRSRVQDIANNCDPRISIRLHTAKYERKDLLIISVEESPDKPVRCSRGFFLREGPNSQKLSRNEILALAAGGARGRS
ncbi:MAG: ATP-binding protein [Deltaproteobacteria bacterium]|nr:ATP-binding protein [Deltaproteobacteria bacterium]MBW1796667.1 ATP-binding protein [Deltaproteobacteria bacterium]